jgi:tetratricopeptide (TPR) repeat protein
MVALALLLTGAGACGDGAEEQAAASEAEWQALQTSKAQLDGKREKLAELRLELETMPVEGSEAAEEVAEEAVGAEPAAGESSGGPTGRAELEQRIEDLENEIATESEEFAARLVTYINSLEIVEGEPLTPEQQAAIRMKSDEDMVVAREWIEKGGDYRRAIDIYEAQLRLDPDYESLEAAIAEAEAMRFMTEDRFSQAQKGMTQADVRRVLGPVNLHNVQQYPEKNTVAWFYPKEGTRVPAAVWFRLDQESGQYVVYQADFESGAARE